MKTPCVRCKQIIWFDKMVKMPNNEAESEDSGPDVNSSESDSEMSGDSSESSEMTENELRIGRKIADYNEILSKNVWDDFAMYF